MGLIVGGEVGMGVGVGGRHPRGESGARIRGVRGCGG